MCILHNDRRFDANGFLSGINKFSCTLQRTILLYSVHTIKHSRTRAFRADVLAHHGVILATNIIKSMTPSPTFADPAMRISRERAKFIMKDINVRAFSPLSDVYDVETQARFE